MILQGENERQVACMVCRKSMADLKPGERAVVTDLTVASDMRRRLQDMGFVKGTKVECIGRSPMGDPAAYLVRRTVIALRCEDSNQIQVEVKLS